MTWSLKSPGGQWGSGTKVEGKLFCGMSHWIGCLTCMYMPKVVREDFFHWQVVLRDMSGQCESPGFLPPSPVTYFWSGNVWHFYHPSLWYSPDLGIYIFMTFFITQMCFWWLTDVHSQVHCRFSDRNPGVGPRDPLVRIWHVYGAAKCSSLLFRGVIRSCLCSIYWHIGKLSP